MKKTHKQNMIVIVIVIEFLPFSKKKTKEFHFVRHDKLIQN